MSAEHCNASQDGSLGIVSADLFQQEYWLESTAAVPPAPVSIAHWTIRCYHMQQMLSFKTFLPSDLSQVPLNREWTFYLFSHITKYLSGGADCHTFTESSVEQCFCFSQTSDFSPLGSGPFKGKVKRIEGQVGSLEVKKASMLEGEVCAGVAVNRWREEQRWCKGRALCSAFSFPTLLTFAVIIYCISCLKPHTYKEHSCREVKSLCVDWVALSDCYIKGQL